MIQALLLAGHELTHLLGAYGYWAVCLCIAAESAGIPLPGETLLLGAAVYAGTTHRLAIALVIAAAAMGATVGDNLGFVAGRIGGYRLLGRYGRYIRVDERTLKLGRYLFLRYGGKVVFFGRFIAILRTWAALLAGTNHMPWSRFLPYNLAGGLAWATLYGLGGYVLGSSAEHYGGYAGVVTLGLGSLVTVVITLGLRRGHQRLVEEAERAFPGPLGPPLVLAVRQPSAAMAVRPRSDITIPLRPDVPAPSAQQNGHQVNAA